MEMDLQRIQELTKPEPAWSADRRQDTPETEENLSFFRSALLLASQLSSQLAIIVISIASLLATLLKARETPPCCYQRADVKQQILELKTGYPCTLSIGFKQGPRISAAAADPSVVGDMAEQSYSSW